MANEDLKAILDERGIEYSKRSTRKQLEVLAAETEPSDDAPLLTDTADVDGAPADVESTPEPEDAPAPAPAVEQSFGTGTRAIERTQPNGAWTCPFCDHTSGALLTTCAKCGGVRDGEKVKR